MGLCAIPHTSDMERDSAARKGRDIQVLSVTRTLSQSHHGRLNYWIGHTSKVYKDICERRFEISDKAPPSTQVTSRQIGHVSNQASNVCEDFCARTFEISDKAQDAAPPSHHVKVSRQGRLNMLPTSACENTCERFEIRDTAPLAIGQALGHASNVC